MKIVNLRTEYLSNPIGVDFVHPTLRWNVTQCQKQTAFQIRVQVNGTPVFDSGKISSSSMFYRLGLAFQSRDKVSWTVTCYDENNISCLSDPAYFEIGLLNAADWTANWIKGDYKVSKKKRYPVDHFKKVFLVERFSTARLYISSLGLYEAYINGKKVGNAVLTPGSTDYRVRVQVDAYDVASLLHEGENEIEVLLADGWYRGSIGAKGFTYVFGKESQIIAQLELDGKTICKTDESWSWCNDGPLQFADLKDGEIVDARKKPTFFGKAKLGRYRGKLSCSNANHVEEFGIFAPVKVSKSGSGKTVFEFQNNIAGYIALKVMAKGGEKLRFVLGEMLDENGDVTLKNVQCVHKGKKTPLQEITYICKPGLNEYKSHFFYGGFKFISFEGDIDVKDLELKQIQIHSKLDRISSFECSNPLINVFYANTIRSIESNSVDIPTDCPTRERMGWTGDSQIIFGTASFLFDYGAFAKKHLRDVFDRQFKNGCLPQIAPYSAEDWFMGVMNGSVGWADVGVLIPYRMYQKYGDTKVLEDNYVNMAKYARFMIDRCGGAKGLYAIYAKRLHLSKSNRRYGVNTGQSYGEWAEPSDVKAFSWKDFAEPHPEESMAYTSYVLGLMKEIANLLGKKEDAALFQQYSEGVKRAYQELVSKPDFSLDTNRQAKLVRPLYMGLLTKEQEEFAKKRLVSALENYGWRLGTGFLSTPFILNVLADIDSEYAYRLLENEEMPGWLYMAIHDTGTIWEGWEGPNSEKGIASLNHYSKGAMVEWLFSGMCGIKVAGENSFIIKPIVGGHVTYAKASYQSVYGEVCSSWSKQGDKVVYEIEVPANCVADIEIGDQVYRVEAGRYRYEVTQSA